jgi:hypothetical protein
MVPARELGRVISREEEDKILGYGPEGFQRAVAAESRYLS